MARSATKLSAVPDGVKSADRVMALLELFRLWRRPASAREISETLEMPRSSTNVLLRSLIQGGYLRFDEQTLTYFPTLKVFQLSSWLVEGFLTDQVLDDVMMGLVAQTQETVCLWSMIGLSARILRVIPSPQAIALSVREDDSASLVGSTVGLAFLAGLSDEAVAALVLRHNQQAAPGCTVDLADIMRNVAISRLRGVSVGYNRWIADAGAVIALIDPAVFGEPLAIAVGGPMFRIQRNESAIESALRSALVQLHSNRTVSAVDRFISDDSFAAPQLKG
jgi:IclR family transcriptional regulator, KDG regulon repressor